MDVETAACEREEYANWKGKKADPEKHGGVMAASFTCVVEVLENLVFLSNATNFITYFIKSMHYPTAEAANMVTNFLGTSFLLTIFGGFISDSYLTRFSTFIIFCIIELLGLTLLTIQASSPRLQPAVNERPSQSQAAILFVGLYAIALGVGGMKAALPAHGADQLDYGSQRLISAFFNWFFFSLCIGGLISSTVMIWIQENLGWNSSFKISIAVLSLALCIFAGGVPVYRFKIPAGSPFTRIFKVLASVARNRKVRAPDSNKVGENPRIKYRFLERALTDSSITEAEVAETRNFVGLLPIFASTILMNCCLAQLQTFSVQQGSVMNRYLNKFQVPTQSLTVFPLIIMISSIPLYELLARSLTDKARFSIAQPLKRIGLGLLLASGAMAVAALVEVKRREAAIDGGKLSVFWLSWQYLLLGVSDMLTLGGMLEFFYSAAPRRMRSICTALSWCSTSMGYFLSSVLVSVMNSVSGKYGRPWLGGHDLNRDRLEMFYAILCILNFVNFLNYIYWAKTY